MAQRWLVTIFTNGLPLKGSSSTAFADQIQAERPMLSGSAKAVGKRAWQQENSRGPTRLNKIPNVDDVTFEKFAKHLCCLEDELEQMLARVLRDGTGGVEDFKLTHSKRLPRWGTRKVRIPINLATGSDSK